MQSLFHTKMTSWALPWDTMGQSPNDIEDTSWDTLGRGGTYWDTLAGENSLISATLYGDSETL